MSGLSPMLWMLYKKSARVLLKATMATLSNQQTISNQQRALIRQISRIINCVRQAHSQHPAWIAQQYGTIDNYLEKHLSADDWRFVVAMRHTDTAYEQPIQHCQPSLSSRGTTVLAN